MNIVLLNSSETPIYQQIVEQIKDAILKGQIIQGEVVPSIRTLAKDLKISVITTKRAYEELEREGLLISVTGKGTFVAPTNMSMLQETRLKEIEIHLEAACKLATSVGIEEANLHEMLTLFYKEI